MNKRTADNWLHYLWTKAVGAPDYIKTDWQSFERELEAQCEAGKLLQRLWDNLLDPADYNTFEDMESLRAVEVEVREYFKRANHNG